MTRGQESLIMEAEQDENDQQESVLTTMSSEMRTNVQRIPLVLKASEMELAEHTQLLSSIQKESKGKCLWLVDESIRE